MIREQMLPQELEALVSYIEEKEEILAQVELPEIEDLPDYKQYLRVQDINIALSQKHLKIIPYRVLVHKTTGKELRLNLPVPDWTKTASDLTSLIDEDGNRILVPATYSDWVTPELTEENPNPEPVLTVIETKDEPYQVNTLKYLITVVENKKFLEAMELFTAQFIADEMAVNPDIFTKLPAL